jgi:RNA polymerase sigma-70 factor (ECF subfamily)
VTSDTHRTIADQPSPPTSGLAPTRWTLVNRARGQTPEARAALADLCEAYYRVVEDFIRRQTGDAQAARDRTHEFFARVLAGEGFGGADPTRGRFRSYLFGAVKNYLNVERVRQLTAKRGGGAAHVSLEAPATETAPGFDVPDLAVESPDLEFDRQWATAMLARALDRLGEAMKVEGKQRQFEVLKPCLQGTGQPPSQAHLAAMLGLNELAVKVAVHRLRKRFREAVRREIAETLDDPATVEEEMRHLVSVLSNRAG